MPKKIIRRRRRYVIEFSPGLDTEIKRIQKAMNQRYKTHALVMLLGMGIKFYETNVEKK